jgi:hypothetical protein
MYQYWCDFRKVARGDLKLLFRLQQIAEVKNKSIFFQCTFFSVGCSAVSVDIAGWMDDWATTTKKYPGQPVNSTCF